MSTNPARRPAGTPTGGQFAPEAHAEPEVTLGVPPPGPESTPTTDAVGIVRWRNADGELHRTDGPAVEYPNGSRSWFVNGERHRDDGPAVERSNGYRAWWVHGERQAGPPANSSMVIPDAAWRPAGDPEEDGGEDAVLAHPVTINGCQFHATAYEVVEGADPQRVRQRDDDVAHYAEASGSDSGFEPQVIRGRPYLVFLTPFDR